MPEFDSDADSGAAPTEGAVSPAPDGPESAAAEGAASEASTPATPERTDTADGGVAPEVSDATPSVVPEPEPAVAQRPVEPSGDSTETPDAKTIESKTTEVAPVEDKPAEPEAEKTEPANEEPAKEEPPVAKTDAVPAESAASDVVPPIVPHEPVVMQVLGGIVTAVDSKEVELTLDDGRAAVIHRENFDLAGTDPTTVLQVGDGSEGAVLSREDPRDRVVLSRKWVLRDRAWKKAAECVKDHSNMHVKVTSVSKKGIVVDVMGLRGFVPLTHFQLELTAPPADLVGQMLELRVIAADRQKDKLLLSRRSALLKEQRKAEVEALQNLKVGSVLPGKVVDLTQFGAFVEVGPENARVRGLLHVSEMSWERIGSPKGHVKVGDEIDVKVIEVKVKKKRVSFSRKALIDDPLASIEVGSIHTGKVKRLVDYGVFVDLGPAEGMVHLSELAEYRPSHPSEIVLRGDEVQVKVLKVNRQKRRVELSMRQALYPG